MSIQSIHRPSVDAYNTNRSNGVCVGRAHCAVWAVSHGRLRAVACYMCVSSSVILMSASSSSL